MSNSTFPQTNPDIQSDVPKYGFYFFAPYISMLVIFLFVGAAIAAVGQYLGNRPIYFLGISTAAYGVFTTIGWALARYVIPGNRVVVARKIINTLGLNGTERVLDVGSGRGLYAIEVARRLNTGGVTGIDIWDPQAIEKLAFHHSFSQPTGNTVENAQINAEIAGVSDKVEFINMDAAHVDVPDRTFDLITSGFVIGHLWRNQQDVLVEIRRVLKDNGRLMIVDNVVDFTYFLLSTPHMFLFSYIRGRKARRLSKKNWSIAIERAGFHISRWQTRRGIITVECTKIV